MQCNGHFRTACPMGPLGKDNMVNGKLFLLAFFHIYVYIYMETTSQQLITVDAKDVENLNLWRTNGSAEWDPTMDYID